MLLKLNFYRETVVANIARDLASPAIFATAALSGILQSISPSRQACTSFRQSSSRPSVILLENHSSVAMILMGINIV